MLNAQVLQRRAERGLGLAIRAGQEEGSILRRREPLARRNQYQSGVSPVSGKSSPYVYASAGDLNSGGKDKPGIYALADNGTEEDFDRAVTEARAEGNVSRANVVRKLKQKDIEAVVAKTHDSSDEREAFWNRVRELADRGFPRQGIEDRLGDANPYVNSEAFRQAGPRCWNNGGREV